MNANPYSEQSPKIRDCLSLSLTCVLAPFYSRGRVSASNLRWACRSVLVEIRVVVRSTFVYRTPLVPSSNVGCSLADWRFLVLLLVVGASRLVAVVILPFPAVAGGVPLLSAMTASRCGSHGFATTSDLGVAVARKVIQLKMVHRALHLIDVESRVSVYHRADVLVLRGQPLYRGFLKSAVGNRLAHLLELRARERFFHKVGVRIFSLIHFGVDERVHFCPDHFVSNLLLCFKTSVWSLLSVTCRRSLILVLECKYRCWFLR